MIIFRYLAKELLGSLFAVSFVLLLIIISARFVSYLAEAAAGGLDTGVLLTLMALRLPGYLELILPLGLVIGIIMGYGRLYVDSELTVLSACGFSERRFLVYTLMTSSFVALLVALFSTYLGPIGVRASEALLAEQRNRTDFETLKPARFHELDDGRGISYAESVSEDKTELIQVFMAQVSLDDTDERLTVLTASSGETVIDQDTGNKFLLLKNGRRYIGRPGDKDYQIIRFNSYAQKLPEPDYNVKPKRETDGLSTFELLERDSKEARAAIQWRISLPVLVMIVSLIALPLSKTQPRRGRYGKLLPAIIIYVLYLVAINAARGMEEGGDAPFSGVIWYVHSGFFLLGIFLYKASSIKRLLQKKNQSANVKTAV
ncbi:LPS export ABC transporter permease LptF [Teredinibacter sp. KSP-S5-2]|uniref:LPS export ABC transporter permease LptF n=1 Tax=Teredinibacter sp. KSP-S5-2 TaxID=3034506 RepID=UPI00293425C6|nr:LPS export ABC transporter permease LptF [Teredinibacter sp. KSP-S5-2]WNO11087.1 LPS export ABC transporter permease LptF [Teredinibacter sp. KSP-S5-2]